VVAPEVKFSAFAGRGLAAMAMIINLGKKFSIKARCRVRNGDKTVRLTAGKMRAKTATLTMFLPDQQRMVDGIPDERQEC